MLRFIKTAALLAVVLALGHRTASAFSLLGPANETWMSAAIGYNTPRDIGAPHNLGEEYRWNTPTNYYAFDQSFLDYFGSNGVAEVEKAVRMLNTSLVNLSDPDYVNSFPLEANRINYRAQEMHLADLKTWALHFTLEELGLTNPERYTWTIRTRETQVGASCPFMIYTIIQRNFDPITFEPSPYVNGNLYTYLIQELCTPAADGVAAWAQPVLVDPFSQFYSAVMSEWYVQPYGLYTTTLTRDDIGGMHYLLRTNNINFEKTSNDTILFDTNVTQASTFFTSNLTQFAQQALTNNAATLLTLYPNLIINRTITNWPVVVLVTNITPVISFPANNPAGFPSLSFATNITPTVQLHYLHEFGNVETFVYTNNGASSFWKAVPLRTVNDATNKAFLENDTTTITGSPYAPAGFGAVTNVVSRFQVTNAYSGEFVILPAADCDLQVLFPILTYTNSFTNIIATFTNAFITGATNVVVSEVTQSQIGFSTNHAFWAYPVQCLTNNSTLREGMDHIQFVRSSFDSLLGRYFAPITNNYTLVSITNTISTVEHLERIVTAPDFLYQAGDLQGTALPNSRDLARTDTAGTFNTTNVLLVGTFSGVTTLAGPGNIEPELMRIVFTKVGPVIDNIYSTNSLNNGLAQSEGTTNLIWASFDGTTADPVLYPSGTSIMALESEVLFQVTAGALPDATAGAAYAAQIPVSGGQSPYGFAFALNSGGLPDGLTMSPSGLISGTPTQGGTYSFTVTVSDAGARSTTRTIVLTVD